MKISRKGSRNSRMFTDEGGAPETIVHRLVHLVFEQTCLLYCFLPSRNIHLNSFGGGTTNVSVASLCIVSTEYLIIKQSTGCDATRTIPNLRRLALPLLSHSEIGLLQPENTRLDLRSTNTNIPVQWLLPYAPKSGSPIGRKLFGSA